MLRWFSHLSWSKSWLMVVPLEMRLWFRPGSASDSHSRIKYGFFFSRLGNSRLQGYGESSSLMLSLSHSQPGPLSGCCGVAAPCLEWRGSVA